MNKFRYLIQGLVAMLMAVCASASQAGLDADLLKNYGGTYMVDCGDPASSKATVFADVLVFLQGDKRIAGGSVEPAFSYFGNSPPEGFLMVLLSEVPGAGQMLWFVYEDEPGIYLTIDGEPKVLDAIGALPAGQKFRRCDGKPAKPAEAPVSTTPRTYELTELSAPGLLMDPKAKAAYYKSLGPLVNEIWLAELDGPSSENVKVMIAGTEYVRAYACMNHDCYDNNTVLLYSATLNVVYGKIYQHGKTTLIGAPPPAVAEELKRLWRELFRSNPQ